ncbi:hypothetical protein [Streptomyces sp. RFCAC02]|uniref:hypothetical protein n=1 Tax=Streptomyces sp. RFCAC02 TaxID=2499143 RepID=UPI001F0F689D|nr:hypothetical protein [Streptomyces sp. RFCAC02]
MAIAGACFAVLLTLALVVNLVGGGRDDAGGPSVGDEAGAVSDEIDRAVGGDPRTVERELVNGVPVGYPRSEAGAVQAAVNYQIARSSRAYLTDAAARLGVIDAIATAEFHDTLINNDQVAMDRVLDSLGITKKTADSLIARGAAMGTRTDSYSDDLATIRVWMTGLVGLTEADAPLPVSASWTTYTLTLQWQADDWKLAAVNSANGPTPLDSRGAIPSTVEEFRIADRMFHAPPFVG